MPITMQGSWTVKVKSKSAAFKQRFVIQGSDGADGTYDGEVSTPEVAVTGAQWTISIQHQPGKGKPWLPSAERLTTPVQAAGKTSFDIRSNDTGADQDYNDLILTCSTPTNFLKHVIYGRVKSYSGFCKFNPCFPYYVVIDTLEQLRDWYANPTWRPLLEELYPDRVRPLRKRPIIEGPPIPEPDPAPFRPLMIPLGEPPVEIQEPSADDGGEIQALAAPAVAESRVLGSASFATAVQARDLARFKDRFRLACTVKNQPGLLLRFLEYDRTSEELLGGPYTGTGDRQVLGLAVTDEQGNYIFCFKRTLGDIVEEIGDQVAGGPPFLTQLRPDVLVQVVSGGGPGDDVLFETALHADIPNLKRIDLCIPEGKINPGPSACQGGRAIQAIGNVFTLPGSGNTLDAAGRITATHFAAPKITRGAWVGRLDLFACFFEKPQVAYYTVRHRRPGGTWSFVDETYRHLFIPLLGQPNHPGHKVGPFTQSLHVDGGPAQNVPAYNNIESDPRWVATHRLRKVRLSSWHYAPNSDPGTVLFKIEGYTAAGNKVAGAEDTIRLYIDNRPVEGDVDNLKMIDPVTLEEIAPGECGLFDLPALNHPLIVRFRADHPGGFMQSYSLGVIRGSNTPVPVSDNTAPVQPLSLTYSEATHGNTFFGTLDAVGPDGAGYVVAELQPDSGSWLPPGKDFCAFAFEVFGTPRVTDGYSLGGSRRLDVELVGIQYTPPSP